MTEQRIDLAPLYDAAAHEARRAWGDSEQLSRVTLRTLNGRKLALSVPPAWEPLPEAATPVLLPLRSPGAIIEVLVTIFEAQRRLTRQEVLQHMDTAGRRRAESVVADALSDLVKVGLLDNRQTPGSKGYGLLGLD